MTDRETGRVRGFGFVEMPDSHAAHSAMDALNGTQSLAAPSPLTKRGRGSRARRGL